MAERHLTRTAVFVILERQGKAFFLRRANTEWAAGYLNIPGGHVEKGEQPREAAAKEAREEAGVVVEPEDLEFVHVDYLRDRYTNFYFRARKWKGEPTIGEPHLASEAVWIDLRHLPDDVTPQLRNLFMQIENGSHYSEIEHTI